MERRFQELVVIFVRRHPKPHVRREARMLALYLRNLNGETVLARLFAGDRNPEKIGASILADIGGRKRRGTRLADGVFPSLAFSMPEIFVLPRIGFWGRFILPPHPRCLRGWLQASPDARLACPPPRMLGARLSETVVRRRECSLNGSSVRF